MPDRLVIYTDGGARGNPGPAAIGVVIQSPTGEILDKFGQTIGETTNNVAEYRAVIAALGRINQKFADALKLSFFLDSTLVTNQLLGKWKIKQPHLKPLAAAARQLIGNRVTEFTAIPREQNTQADKLVNQALDKC